MAGFPLRQVNILARVPRHMGAAFRAWFALINETHVWLRAVHGKLWSGAGCAWPFLFGNQGGPRRESQMRR